MVKSRLGVFGMVGSLLLGGCVAAEDGSEELGYEQSEIVGGTDADISAFPHQVSLQIEGSHFCGGSVLDANWVLTAQHCVNGVIGPSLPPSLVKVAAGTTDVTSLGGAQVRDVAEVIQLAGYTDPSTGKDAALLRLSTALDLSTPAVKAIPLVTSADETAGATAPGVVATVTGWGTLSEGGQLSEILQAVDVPIVANADAGYGPLTSDQLAAGVMGIGGKDSCQGDSGGPLVVQLNGAAALAGIVSWGEGCARPEFAGMYGRVASFGTWIGQVQASTLSSLLSKSNLSGRKGQFQRQPFTVTVPAGALSLNVNLSGGSGDADLYVRFGSAPTTGAYTCRPFLSGNTESCGIASPKAGTWYINVRGFSTFSGAALTATRR
jgi:secreted trypsin-like serine protease